MRGFLKLVAALAATSLLVLPASAFGQASRTWVSGVGDDANPCSRTAPCKTFAGAISKTAVGGEINVLDPGGFGAVTITKSITIKAKGELGSVLVSGTNGINIAAGPNDRVTLYGLELTGISGAGINGVRITQAKSVRIEHTEIYGFNTNGIDFEPSNAGAKLIVSDSSIHGNGAAPSTNGVYVAPSGTGTARVTLAHDGLDDNFNGLFVSGPTQSATVDVLHTTISTNDNAGIYATGAAALVRLFSSEIIDNTYGIPVDSGGQIQSFGNNAIVGNGSSETPTGTVALK